MAKKTKGQELQEQLTWAFPHIGKDKPEQAEKAFKYCEGYKEFLDVGKTERECVKEAVKMLKRQDISLLTQGNPMSREIRCIM